MMILKEKTAQKNLDKIQSKARSRLANLEALKSFATRQVGAVRELNSNAIGLSLNLLGMKFAFNSAKEAGDYKPFYAGAKGGKKVYPSTTIIIFKFITDSKIEIINMDRA